MDEDFALSLANALLDGDIAAVVTICAKKIGENDENLEYMLSKMGVNDTSTVLSALKLTVRMVAALTEDPPDIVGAITIAAEEVSIPAWVVESLAALVTGDFEGAKDITVAGALTDPRAAEIAQAFEEKDIAKGVSLLAPLLGGEDAIIKSTLEALGMNATASTMEAATTTVSLIGALANGDYLGAIMIAAGAASVPTWVISALKELVFGNVDGALAEVAAGLTAEDTKGGELKAALEAFDIPTAVTLTIEIVSEGDAALQSMFKVLSSNTTDSMMEMLDDAALAMRLATPILSGDLLSAVQIAAEEASIPGWVVDAIKAFAMGDNDGMNAAVQDRAATGDPVALAVQVALFVKDEETGSSTGGGTSGLKEVGLLLAARIADSVGGIQGTVLLAVLEAFISGDAAALIANFSPSNVLGGMANLASSIFNMKGMLSLAQDKAEDFAQGND